MVARRMSLLALCALGMSLWPQGQAQAAPTSAAPAAAVTVPARFHNVDGLRVEFEFVAAPGTAQVDAQGVQYQVGEGRPFRGTVHYPEPFWRAGYALFIGGQPMGFKLRVRNESGRAVRDLQIVAVLEQLNFFGKDGDDLPGSPSASFAIGQIAARGVWEAQGTILLPLGLAPWMQQVHVQVQKASRKGEAKLLCDDPHAGLYFPPELSPSGT